MSALASTPSTRGLSRAMSSRSSIVRRSAIARGWPPTPIIPRAVWSAATMNSTPSAVSARRRRPGGERLGDRAPAASTRIVDAGRAYVGVVEHGHRSPVSSHSLQQSRRSRRRSAWRRRTSAARRRSPRRRWRTRRCAAAASRRAGRARTPRRRRHRRRGRTPPRPAAAATTAATVGRGDEHAVAAELDDRHLDAARRAGRRPPRRDRRCRRRRGTRRGCRWPRSPRRSAPPMTADAVGLVGHSSGAVVEVEHGVRAPGARGEHRRRSSMRAGSSAIAEPATHSTPTSATRAVVDVAGPRAACPGAVRLAVEEQLRILGRRQRGEGQRRAQRRGRARRTRVSTPNDVELGDDVVAERVGADLGEHGAAVPEPRRGHGDVGRRAADRLDEALRDRLKPAPGCVGVEVDADPPDRQQVERHHRSRRATPHVFGTSGLDLVAPAPPARRRRPSAGSARRG